MAAAIDENTTEVKKTDYYNSGSNELATETPLTINRLETRRRLTKNSKRLVIVLVGLPARGKSFVARKLLHFLKWYGSECKIFNVGRYRRQAYAELSSSQHGACNADFFDSKNKKTSELREQVASIALEDMLRWLDEEDMESDDDSQTASTQSQEQHVLSDRVAIFDATNSTDKRRKWILEECTSPTKRKGKPTGCIFVESLCDDQELIMENYKFKISNSPDYTDMSTEAALVDLQERVSKYEEQYETINDDSLSYIKIFNLSTKLLVNHIYGRMSKIIVPALMAWNIGTRPIFLCRPGQTSSDVCVDLDDNVQLQKLTEAEGNSSFMMSPRPKLNRGDSLGQSGKAFSNALYDFVVEEGTRFLEKRSNLTDTGTSVSGLAPIMHATENDREPPFPLKIFTSTMPRARETVAWDHFDFPMDELSNLNPLDKGDFNGKELEELKEAHPSWYTQLEKNAFSTRFPGGESYKDMIGRLETIVVDLEQQVVPTMVVSHVSTLQVLMAYFRKTPVQRCMEIEVPLHTVIKFTPARGGGWSETQIPLSPLHDHDMSVKFKFEGMDQLEESHRYSIGSPPIWGDHHRRPSFFSVSSGASSRNVPSGETTSSEGHPSSP